MMMNSKSSCTTNKVPALPSADCMLSKLAQMRVISKVSDQGFWVQEDSNLQRAVSLLSS